jgi:hypothetical protein
MVQTEKKEMDEKEEEEVHVEDILWPRDVRFAGPMEALTDDWLPERLTVIFNHENVVSGVEYG